LSRIGKKPVPIPKGVEVKIDGQKISVKGPKGSLTKTVHPGIKVIVENDAVQCTGDIADRLSRSVWGLWRMLIANMVEGVTTGYRETLDIQGVATRPR